MKAWYESKTVWFFLLFLLVNVAGLFGFTDFSPTPEQAEWVGAIVSVIGLVLRAVTSSGVGLKK